MKILVDARPLATVGNGNARYLSGMLDAATLHRPDWHWHLLSPRALHPFYAGLFSRTNVEVTIDRSSMLAAKAGPLWLHLRLPGLIQELQPDLFWSTLFLLPFRYRSRSSIPSILNIHDMNPFVAPETMKGWVRIYTRQFMRSSILEADRVLCLSATTRADILRHVPGVAPERLAVQYPGMIPPPENRRRPGTLPAGIKDFFLAVGTLEPRKNFDTLIAAYLKARARAPGIAPLVIAGNPGWNMSETLVALREGRYDGAGIHYAGAPSDTELFWLYENARALFFPSLHEGFGLPALEAAWFGKPVCLSDIPIFREILPGAEFTAIGDVDGWADRFLFFLKHRGKAIRLKRDEWTYRHRGVQLCKELERAVAVRQGTRRPDVR